MFVIDAENPLACCGLVTAKYITCEVREYKKDTVHPYTKAVGYWASRYATEDDIKERLVRLKNTTESDCRSCCLILLSSEQEDAIRVALSEGFKVIHEFWNPNSGNMCYMLTHTQYMSRPDGYCEDE